MTATTFEDRISQIEKRRPNPEFNPIRFAQTAGAAPKRRRISNAAVGRNLAAMALGTVAGALVGVVVQGAVMPGSPWGPATQHGALIGMFGLGALLASLPLALVSVYMRRRRPGFFFFSAAYAIASISVALM